MPLNQKIDSALEKTIGAHGVSDSALSAALARTEGALDRLRQHYAEGTLPLLRLPASTCPASARSGIPRASISSTTSTRFPLRRCSRGCRLQRRASLRFPNP